MLSGCLKVGSRVVKWPTVVAVSVTKNSGWPGQARDKRPRPPDLIHSSLLPTPSLNHQLLLLPTEWKGLWAIQLPDHSVWESNHSHFFRALIIGISLFPCHPPHPHLHPSGKKGSTKAVWVTTVSLGREEHVYQGSEDKNHEILTREKPRGRCVQRTIKWKKTLQHSQDLPYLTQESLAKPQFPYSSPEPIPWHNIIGAGPQRPREEKGRFFVAEPCFRPIPIYPSSRIPVRSHSEYSAPARRGREGEKAIGGLMASLPLRHLWKWRC